MPKDQNVRHLLNEAIDRAHEKKGKSKGAIIREIADSLNYSSSNVERWRRGFVPNPPVFKFLVRYFARDMGRVWAKQLLQIAVDRNLLDAEDTKSFLEEVFRPAAFSNKPPSKAVQTQLGWLMSKLMHLQNLDDCPIALVGSIYLDQMVGPVETRQLHPQEWMNIEAPKFDLGGSGIWVGRYLYQSYGKRSHLFGVIGRGSDELTNLFARRLKRETWNPEDSSKNENVADSELRWALNCLKTIGAADSRTAVTFHLLQAGLEYTTMLTHRGVLDSFNWHVIKDDLTGLLSHGGVLYISGYLKTKLREELLVHLREFAYNNTLVCIDHGNLVRGDVDQSAVRNLQNAFKAHVADIYFCTLNELWEFCHFKNQEFIPKLASQDEVLELLASLSRRNADKLPLVTVLRDKNLVGEAKAYLLIGERPYPIEGDAGNDRLEDCIGPKNAFNAAFMHYLIEKGPEALEQPSWRVMESLLQEAARSALDKWHNTPDYVGPFRPY